MAKTSRMFGDLLTKAIRMIAADENKPISIVQQEIGQKLGRGLTESPIEYWRKGNVPSDPEDLKNLTKELAIRGGFKNETDCKRFLRNASHTAPRDMVKEIFASLDAERLKRTAGKSNPPSFLANSPPSTHLGDFVARSHELDQLDAALTLARSGHGQIVFVTGAAGSGKTSLVRKFAQRAQAREIDLIVTSGACNSYVGVGSPYLPFQEALCTLAGDVKPQWESHIITTEYVLHLWDLLPLVVTTLLDYGPNLINAFVDGEDLAHRAAEHTEYETDWQIRLQDFLANKKSPSERRELNQDRIFDEFTSVFKALATRAPLLLMLDDLHWSDSSTNGLLFHMAACIVNSPILIVGTYRPEDIAQTDEGRQQFLMAVVRKSKRLYGDIEINLDDIADTEERKFVDALLAREPNSLSESFRQELVRHGRGHPLFTIELLEEMKDRGCLIQDGHGQWNAVSNLNWNSLPAGVEEVIENRIERLDPDLRDILNVASVEGEVFTAEAIARVLAIGPREIIRRLSTELARQHRLVVSHGSRRLGRQLLTQYQFRHILFQRYLYSNLDETEGIDFHESMGNALKDLHGEQSDEIANQLAHHFYEANLVAEAIDNWHQAGERAVRLSANDEAIEYFNHAIALLEDLSDPNERQHKELMLRISQGKFLMATKGYTAQGVESAFSRAQELCHTLEENSQLPLVLAGLRTYYMTRGDLYAARERGEQSFEIAQRTQDPWLLLASHEGLGVTYTHLGQFSLSKYHLEQGISLYDRNKRHVHRALPDSGVDCLCYAALIFWILGYPEQAITQSQRALMLADDLSHPHSQALAHFFASVLYHFLREPERTLAHAQEAIKISNDHEFLQWAAHAKVMRGWAFAQQDQIPQAVADLQSGLNALQETGGNLSRAYYLSLLAEIYGQIGEASKGLNLLNNEAMQVVESCNEYWSLAELYRVKGELIQILGVATSEVEVCLRHAREIARLQMAKSFELRATICLSKLLSETGKKKEAWDLLSENYNWFSEGKDTVDLKKASVTLSDLHGEQSMSLTGATT